MSDIQEQRKTDTTDVGWRLQQLRIRRGLQQKEFARLAGVDAGFLNRLERGSSRRSHPKPNTVNKLLDALGATQAEREAVFHAEVPVLTAEEISAQVAEFMLYAEDNSNPMVLIDEHWYRWYMNRMARRMFDLSGTEYAKTLGEHVLQSYVDEASPLYERYPVADRFYYFTQRLVAFQTLFADQQFDSWYLEVAQKITQTSIGAQVWHHPAVTGLPIFLHQQEVRYTNPDNATFSVDGQINILLRNPRFAVITSKAQDEQTRELLDSLQDR